MQLWDRLNAGGAPGSNQKSGACAFPGPEYLGKKCFRKHTRMHKREEAGSNPALPSMGHLWLGVSSMSQHLNQGVKTMLYPLSAIPLPWERPRNYPPVRLTPKVHLLSWYTSGFK